MVETSYIITEINVNKTCNSDEDKKVGYRKQIARQHSCYKHFGPVRCLYITGRGRHRKYFSIRSRLITTQNVVAMCGYM